MGERVRHGVDGLDGASAYELAVVHGFQGTLPEWIASLKGEPGRRGDDADPALIEALVARAVSEIPHPIDGLKGDRGNQGELGGRGPRGARGKDAILPPAKPARADFERHPETLQTLRVRLANTDGSGTAWDLWPTYDSATQMVQHVDIVPT